MIKNDDPGQFATHSCKILLKKAFFLKEMGPVLWLTYVIPATWEVEVGESNEISLYKPL
jgi:hypothetical protein